MNHEENFEDDDFGDDPFAEFTVPHAVSAPAQSAASTREVNNANGDTDKSPTRNEVAAAALAEILESNTHTWTAQCRALHCAPPFGSFVRAPEDDRREVIYGVVARISTEPIDASRRPFALWTSEDEMPSRHPQIGKLLRTVFEVKSVGWGKDAHIARALPHQPPRLHTFVLPCSSEDVRLFTADVSWTRLLLESGEGDELLVAACREAVRAHNNDMAYKVQLGRALATPLRADYHRLRAILARLDQ